MKKSATLRYIKSDLLEKRALRAAFEPAEWVDENRRFEAQGETSPF